MTSLATELAFWQSEPRDAGGEWITLWHGTSKKTARSIQKTGLTSASYGVAPNGMPFSPNLTPDRREALMAAHDVHVPPDERASVVEVRVPRDLEQEYLHPAFGHMGYRAIRKPLPPSMIYSVQAEQQSPMEEFQARQLDNSVPASGQAIELASGAAWLHELRDADGKWTRSPTAKVGTGLDRYAVPPHSRLINDRADYPDPADYPFFKKHPVSPQHIIDAYDAVPQQLRAPGRTWYPDAHLLAKAIAGGNAEKGAILLANYSPQANWPINMFRAARAFADNKPIPAGEGFVSGDQVKKAQRALDGESLDSILVSPKIRSFAHLIERGDDSPDDPYGHVVIDAHALNVAAGGDIRGATYGTDAKRKKLLPEDEPPIGKDVRAHEYVGDQYREAAQIISKRDGVLMKPYELQAITWVAQVMSNQAEDRAEMEQVGSAKGRLSARAKDWQRWLAWAKEHNIPLQSGVSALAAQVAELLAEGSLAGQIELTFNPDQLRGPDGKWIRTPGAVYGLMDRPGVDPEQLHELQQSPGMPSRRMRREITADEARGNSRPVSSEEFQHLAAIGNRLLDQRRRDKSPLTGLDRNWAEIKAKTYLAVQDSWGGATIDAHTGQPLATDADQYALSVKPASMHTVSVPETASEAEFSAAMDQALATFRPVLQRRDYHLGVFHDDENNRIDIDPVLVVPTTNEVETIGAYAHSVGGAYHFKTGDGYWPPHVAKAMNMAADPPVRWDGPGQWHSYADLVQDGEPPEDDSLSSQLADDPEPGTLGS